MFILELYSHIKFNLMITRDNIKSVLLSLEREQVQAAWYSAKEYIGVWASSYGQVCIDVFDMDNDEDVMATGGFITDKDGFALLFKEQGLNLDEII